MKRHITITFCLLVTGLAAQSPVPITADQRTGLEVTIYNNNLGLVKDTRAFDLAKGGRVELLLEEVATKIQPETVLPVSRTPKLDWVVLEQNYEYDLLTPNTLLSKYVGKQVQLLTYDANNEITERQRATLLSLNDGPIYQVGREIHVRHPGHVILPEVPEELVARPSLRWLAEADKGRHEVQVSYLTGGLTWKADYVLKIDQAATIGDLTGWITLNNQSGIPYPQATVKLVAGEVHRVTAKRGARPRYATEALAMRAPQVQEEAFMDFHLYTIPWKTTIKQNQQKQVELLHKSGVGLTRRYVVEMQGAVPHPPRQEAQKVPVKARLNFMNTKANQLGDPLPGGIIRIYSADHGGHLQFAGEDRIPHTPRDERVEINYGQAFDLVAEVKRLSYTRLGDRDKPRYEQTTQVSLRNRKEKGQVTIEVRARFAGDWQIKKSTHDYEKVGAFTAVFTVPVPAGKEVTVEYTARVKQ